ncbi:MAG: hypothetical protein U5K69_28655 [Balneolaceae bacterium]|nr:hypothetical protein [Balneolaceae bacterium]
MGQDRLTRSHLLGVGIVCGLTVEFLDNSTIRINSGVGITSHGYMVSMPTTNCTHIWQYTDPGTLDTTAYEAEAGTYPPFNKDDMQITLWELLAVGDDAGPDMYPIDKDEGTVVDEETGEKVKFQNYCVLLYLEMEDQDLEDCFGDDCEENGVQRNLNWRKLLIKKADLEAIIEEQRPKVDWVDEVTASQNLLDPYVERLGYYNDKNLSLANYNRFGELAKDYRSIIKNAAVRVGQALHESYKKFEPLLSDLYPSNPFSECEKGEPKNNKLCSQITDQVNSQPEAEQYAYDFLKDLVDAYEEFRDVAS